MSRWTLHEAKARLSELIRAAHADDPQTVTVHGKPAAIVFSAETYEAMKKRRPGFVALMRNSPLVGEDLVIDRSDSPVRNFAL